MNELPELFANNRRWATGMESQLPGFFAGLAAQQAPRYLWIGCSDSRVPANEIVGLAPGELFVHRNVANLVLHTDFSCLSVLQYAIDVLRVEHVMVVGHYGCGGVQAAWEDRKLGLVDNWLQSVRDVAHLYLEALRRLPDDAARLDRLCELNVLVQARRLCRSTVVQQAWERGQRLVVHAWVYRLTDGLLRDLGFCATDLAAAEGQYARVAGAGSIGAMDPDVRA
jgi:carbonic anhydrase